MSTIPVGYDCESDADDAMAGQMLFDLCQAYPGHSWFILIKGGVVHVKDLDLSDRWGMCLHYSQIKGDAQQRKHDLLQSAGEFLERANLKRGAYTGQAVTKVEGIPDKDMQRVGL